MEDLLEEIVGNIRDEYDDEEIEMRELGEGVFTIEGNADPEEALGSLLFSAVALARSLGIDPEDALNKHCDTFLAGVRQAEHGQSITNRPETAEYEGVMKHEQN